MLSQKQLLGLLSLPIILLATDYSVAQDRDYPPSHPPVERTEVLTVQPVTDRPLPPPPVEKRKPVFGGPVNNKKPDPPTTIPDKRAKGIKKVFTKISLPTAKIKDEVVQIDIIKMQGASLKDAMPMRTISASSEKSVGPKNVTVNISSPGRKSGKSQVRPVYKLLTERSLERSVTSQSKKILTTTISNSKPTPPPAKIPPPIPPSDQYSSWINALIAKEESEPVANPPAILWECTYENQTVYYLPPSSRCCDTASVLYNEDGEVICAPGGGLTGRGDGRCPDFYEGKKDCEIIWEDSRSSH